MRSARPTTAGPPPRLPAILLGLGLGGFVDGIVLHQLLQWHHMATGLEAATTLAGLEVNTLADGLFHAVAWLLVLAGSLAMVRAWQAGRLAPSWRFHLGLLLAGWGLFNLVEGLVSHHLLGLHHVRDDLGGPIAWDIGFLLSGVVMVLVGWAWHHSAPPCRVTQGGTEQSTRVG